MAIINEAAFKSRIKTGNLPNVCVMFGEDAYLKDMYTEKLSRMTAGKDDVFNYQSFENGCNLQAVYDSVTQMPVMSDKKYVILNDYNFEKCSKSDFDRLCEIIENVDPDCVFVLRFDIVEIDAKKSARFKKLMSVSEKNGGVTVQLDHRSASELVKMLTDGAKKRGCAMSSSAARLLIETSGEDINTLASELEKLCFYAPGSEITEKHIENLAVKTVEASVYELSSFIFSRRTGEAMRVLDDLFFMHIKPVFIYNAISSPYVDMYRLYAFKKSGLGRADVVKTFNYGRKDFLVDRAAKNLQSFDFKKLSLSLRALLEADGALKTSGSDARTVFEQLIVKLVYIIAKGEAVDKA